MLSPFWIATFAALATAAPGGECGIGSWAHWAMGYDSNCTTTSAGSTGSVDAVPTPGGGPQVPFKFPLKTGYPQDLDNATLTAIIQMAQGSTPNTALPTKLAPSDITTFQAVAFNEIFEVAFFSSFIDNLTQPVQGYDNVENKDYVLETLTTVVAQEQLHYLGANAILKSVGAEQIQPCQYKFPSDTFLSAIDFTRTQTELVLGSLQDAVYGLAANGDSELIPLLTSVIGNEAEQVGYYRSLLDLVAAELPFLTRSFGPWLYSFLNQRVVIPGSCPNAHIIDVPIFGPLSVLAGPDGNGQDLDPGNQQLTFSFTNNGTNLNNIALVYVNQQNLPIVEAPSNIQSNGDNVTFTANFPYTANSLNGLTIAVVAEGKGPFASTQDVATATLFGPGIITVN